MTRNVLDLPLTRRGTDALRLIQASTRAEAVAVMADRPDCSWLRLAMQAPGTVIQSLGSFWLFASGERWPCVAFWVTHRTRRTVMVYPSRNGSGWSCQTRESDAVHWGQFAGNAQNRGFHWLDGEAVTAPQVSPAPQTAPAPHGG